MHVCSYSIAPSERHLCLCHAVDCEVAKEGAPGVNPWGKKQEQRSLQLTAVLGWARRAKTGVSFIHNSKFNIHPQEVREEVSRNGCNIRRSIYWSSHNKLTFFNCYSIRSISGKQDRAESNIEKHLPFMK